MKTTHTSSPMKLHRPGSYSPTVSDWIITSAKSPDPVTNARCTVIGMVPSHIEGNPMWDYPTDVELHEIALLFKFAPDLLKVCKRLTTAAANRENSAGDPCHYLECVAEVRAAVTQANQIIAQIKPK